MTTDKVATAVAPASVVQVSSSEEPIQAVAVALPLADPTSSTASTLRLRPNPPIPPPRFRLSERSLDAAFNDIWANNANAISHCYSNTDALKVDFTRTGKRSIMGMINDATNSVYRMVQGAVTDFFRQTVLDFVYGSIGLTGLERYYDDLDSRDPSEAVRLVRVRASAIEGCRREVVPEEEPVLGGWTLCSPVEPNQVVSAKLEEKVVLLTRKALYVCSYDFSNEQLSQFTKVLIGDIVSIQEGLYIINPNEGHHPEDNWGFVVTYLHHERRQQATTSIKLPSADVAALSAASSPGEGQILAFRAISADLDLVPTTSPFSSPNGKTSTPSSRFGFSLDLPLSSFRSASDARGGKTSDRGQRRQRADEDDDDDDAPQGATSRQTVARILDLLVQCCEATGVCESGDEFVQSHTIQSLAQAKANAGYFGPWIEGLKRRLWL